MTHGSADVGLYQLAIDVSAPSVAEALHVLSTDEWRRYEHYGSRTRAAHFAVVRAWVRTVLAPHVGEEPQRIPIESPRHHKPRLAPDAHLPDIRFSVTHSGALALCLIGRERDVGVDVETGRSETETAALAATTLTVGERSEVAALPRALRHEAVLRQWTRKEAVLKAIGSGLRIPPAQLALEVGPVRLDAPIAVNAGGRRWTLEDLAPAPAAIGATAVALV